MVRYWWDVFKDGFWASIDAIGQPLQVLAYASLAFVLGGILIWHRHGWQAMKDDIYKTAVEVVFVGLLAWIPFFIVSVGQISYLRWKVANDASLAAKKETDAANQKLEDLRRPKLSGRFNQAAKGDTSRGCELFIDISIKNSGAPSIATGWYLSANSEGFNIDKLAPTLIPDDFTVNDHGKVVAKFEGDFRLEDRTSRAAIMPGVPIGGWLRFIFPDISQDKLVGAQIALHFQDVDENQYSVPIELKPYKLGASTNPSKTPNSGDNPFILRKSK
jgi:hypothetical protein